MKNLSYVINGILSVAIIVLFILHFTGGNNSAKDSDFLKFESDSTIVLPIAYVDVDTLLTKYTYAKEIREILLSESESSKVTLTNKQKKIAAEQQDFQRKYESNAFISQERAEAEYQRIQKLGIDLEQTAARLDNELAMKQMKFNAQLADSVKICITEYNKIANYQIVFSNSGLDNILIAGEKYNITEQILDLLNSRHTPSAK